MTPSRTVARALALAALAPLALLPSCDLMRSCTEMGCGAAFRVELAPALAGAADYRIDVTADGVLTSCTVTLPFASCTGAPACVPPESAFLVERSGCALPASEHQITGVLWPASGPTTVTVEVRRNGTLLATGTYTPTYRSSEPNGPDCGPVCTEAEAPATLVVP
ncbi:MAG: hypothetical protein HY908_19320 [Myxococcales bacterium]|nr:hypothetical protein [Myxococcales bacterium]